MSYLRSIPPLLVLVLSPILLIALVVGVIGLPVWLILAGVHVSGGLVGLSLLLSVSLIGGLVYAIREIRNRPRANVEGPELGRSRYPALWLLVDELAEGVQTRTPDRIIVDAEVGASVVEVRRERVLRIGLPILATFTIGQLRVVLAHELGHFAGGKYALGSFLLRAQDALITVTQNASGVWAVIFKAYTSLYIWAERGSARQMEIDADEFSVRLGGSEASASAFERVVETELAWNGLNVEFVSRYFELAHERASLAEGLREVMSVHPEALRDQAEVVIADAKPSRWDTHPLIRDRIARVSAARVAGPAGGDVPALSLLGDDVDSIEAQLLTEDLPLVGWDQLARDARRVFDRRQAVELATRVRNAGISDAPTPRIVLTALLSDPVETGDEADAARTWGVFDVLQTSGGVTFVHEWDAGGHWEDAAGVVKVAEMLGDHTPAVLAPLLGELEHRGVDLDRPYEIAVVEESEVPDDALLAALTCTTLGWASRFRDLLVFGSGILLSPRRVNGFTMAAGGAREDRQQEKLLRRLDELGLDGLRAVKRAIWLPRGSSVPTIAKGGRKVLIDVSGSVKPLRVKVSQYTAVLGELPAALELQAAGPAAPAAGSDAQL